jgi:hypothetical protein
MRSWSAAYLLDQDVSGMSVYDVLEGISQEEGMACLQVRTLFFWHYGRCRFVALSVLVFYTRTSEIMHEIVQRFFPRRSNYDHSLTPNAQLTRSIHAQRPFY